MEGRFEPRSRWTSIAYGASVRISELLMTHSWHWGVNHFPVILLQPISLALFVLLGDLNDPTHARAFSHLCFWVHSVSVRLRVAEGILAVVERKARELGVTVPQEAREYFANRQTESSDQPEADIEYLVGKWVEFDIGG